VPYETLRQTEASPSLRTNIEIISKERQNTYSAQTKRLSCMKKGAGAVQFLLRHFTFLGFEGQNWMLVVAGVIAVYIFFVWKARHWM
jgi:hypothetical protein